MTAERHAATVAVDLEFVDQPPAAQRGPNAPTPPTPIHAGRRLRVVTPPDHVAGDSRRPHGSHAKYVVERCRCQQCKAANRTYEQNRQHKIRRPDEVWAPYVPAGPTRNHIAQLRHVGVGVKEIAKLSGIPHGALSKLVYGGPGRRPPSRRIRKHTADAILNIPLDPALIAAVASDRVNIPAAPTWVLLDDLISRGFTKTYLAGQLGIGKTLQIRRTVVRASTARNVANLHRRLQGVDAPPRKTRWSQ